VFERQGTAIATIANTPATVNVPKRKYDIMIRCNKFGYQEAAYLNHSGVTALIAGNIAADVILTAGLSSVVDSADGADNKYDSAVNMTLVPMQQIQSPVATAIVTRPAVLGRCSEREKADDDGLESLAREKGYQYRPRCN
jgi:hypothetical protein